MTNALSNIHVNVVPPVLKMPSERYRILQSGEDIVSLDYPDEPLLSTE